MNFDPFRLMAWSLQDGTCACARQAEGWQGMVAKTQVSLDGRWDDVRLFLALYRRHTLAAAAALVGLDASTLSRRLVALEEALGSALFDRTREGLLPTQAAELLLPAAEEMAAAHARFAHEASGFERVT